MLRLLILALLIYGILTLWRKAGAKKNPVRPDPKNLAAGEMVMCAHCKTFVLKNESINNGGNLYCSEDCKKGGRL